MNILKNLNKHYIKFGNKKITVIIDKNNMAWFSCKETAKVLGYTDLKQAIRQNIKKTNLSQLKDINISKQKKHPHTLFMDEAGLYRLLLRSKMPQAEKFADWVTHDVLPSIRKYGYYKLKKKFESKYNEILKKIDKLEKQNIILNSHLKKDKYPKGGLVYVVDYSDDINEIYRVGRTSNLTSRKKLYDSHTLKNHKIVLIEQTDCPIKLETCLRALLYDSRYKDKKDFYACSLEQIRKSMRICVKSIEDSKEQKKGGRANMIEKLIKIMKEKKKKLVEKIRKLEKKINR